MKFADGDWVFLKVTPRKGTIRLGKKGKLAPRYVGPFEIVKCVGEVAYQLDLPPHVTQAHNVFHVSILHRYISDPTHIINWQDIRVQDDVTYEERPVQVLDARVQVLRNKVIPLVKVLWQHHGTEEATWETEAEIRSKYPELFA